MRLLLLASCALSAFYGYCQSPKVLVLYDMEGLSGVTHHDEVMKGTARYERGRHLLTQDVNAAIAGLKAGGAATIVVADAHGSGNKEADILLPQMNAAAIFDHRSLSNEPYIDCIDSTFDAVVCIGMHARAFTQGFIAHTYTDDISFNVNGHELTETDIIAISAARYGVPLIMVSGDDVLEQQLRPHHPGLYYATVKHSKSFDVCDTLPLPQAHQRIYTAALQAIQQYKDIPPYKMSAPFGFTLRFRTARQARQVLSMDGLNKAGAHAVAFTATDFAAGFRQSLKVIPLVHKSGFRFWWDRLVRSPGSYGVLALGFFSLFLFVRLRTRQYI